MIPKGYKSMDSAPKDRVIVVVFADGIKRRVRWQDNEWLREEENYDGSVQPPVPEATDCWAEQDGRDYHEVYDALHWREVSALDLVGFEKRT